MNQDHKPKERGYGYQENFKGRLTHKTEYKLNDKKNVKNTKVESKNKMK